MSLISIITTVYYTAASLPDLLAEFQRLAQRNPRDDFEFIFVNDGSGDNSHEVMLELMAREPRMRVIDLARNFGAIPAVLAGLSQARGDAVAAVASDLQDPPALIHEMLVPWRAGKKVVIAARRGRGDPWLNTLMADTFYRLFRRYAIPSMPSRGFDFFLIDRQVCDLINHVDERNTYLMGLILWLGFAPEVIDYDRREREERYGASMWTFLKRLKYFIDAFVAFSYMPVRAASLLGIFTSIAGLIYAAVIVVLRLLYQVKIEGWTSLMVVLLVVSGVQMIMIGILGEYLWRNLEQSRRRPNYVIDRVITAPGPESRDHPQQES